jgi:hypothetical protein
MQSIKLPIIVDLRYVNIRIAASGGKLDGFGLNAQGLLDRNCKKEVVLSIK